MKYDIFQRDMDDYLRYQIEWPELLRKDKEEPKSWEEIFGNPELAPPREKK